MRVEEDKPREPGDMQKQQDAREKRVMRKLDDMQDARE